MAITCLIWEFIWRRKPVIHLKDHESRVPQVFCRPSLARDTEIAVFQVEDVGRKHQHRRVRCLSKMGQEAIPVQNVASIRWLIRTIECLFRQLNLGFVVRRAVVSRTKRAAKNQRDR
jgi:hypothetical protein